MMVDAPRRDRGYSLPELMVVIGIIALLGVVSLTHYRQLQMSGYPSHAAVIYTYALREAQQHALGGDADTSWGVAIVTGGVTVFSGTSYVARTVANDKTYWLPTITVTGATTTVFSKFTGLPSGAATTTFNNEYDSATTTLSTGGAAGYTL